MNEDEQELFDTVIRELRSGSTNYYINDEHDIKPRGVAHAKSFLLTHGDMCICYYKYIVENYDIAKQQKANGIEYNNVLIGNVMVLSKCLGNGFYKGHDAQEIVSVCEKVIHQNISSYQK